MSSGKITAKRKNEIRLKNSKNVIKEVFGEKEKRYEEFQQDVPDAYELMEKGFDSRKFEDMDFGNY